MAIGTVMIYISLIVILAVCVGGILLQIFLSKRESWWPGLILPLLTFLYSLLAVFSVVITDTMGGWEIFTTTATAFITANIPTIVLLAIYFACREKKKRRRELEKMKLQDLN